MKNRRYLALTPLAVVAFALLTSLAPAHGPSFPGIPPTPQPQPPTVYVPAGGGNLTGTGGIGGVTRPFTPTGRGVGLGGGPGGNLPAVAGSGSLPNAGGGGATTPGVGGGRSGLGAARPLPRPSRTKMSPRWREHMKVSWVSAFPIADEKDGYAASAKDIAASLETDPSEGGWVREPGPSVVLVYDPTSQKHRNAIENLDKDLRLVAATRLFNCFKVDGRVLGKGGTQLSLTVYDDDGTKVGDLAGRKLRKAIKLLEEAYDRPGVRLTKVLPKVESNARGVATCEMDLEMMERQIVCPDCGEKRDDVLGNIAKTTALRDQYKAALATYWMR